MAIRTSNQVAHIPGRLISVTNTAPGTSLPKNVAHGRVSDDNIATFLAGAAADYSCFYWHEALKRWVYAGYGAATYKVTFEQYGTYAWSVPKGAYVYFQASIAGPTDCYTDLDPIS